MPKRTTATEMKRRRRNRIIGISLGIVVVGVVLWFALNPAAIFGPIPAETSTFTLISYTDGEDVSDFVEITVWVPDSDYDQNFTDREDIYNILNFEAETESDAEDVSIDLTPYLYVWIEIDDDGDTVFANDFYLVSGGANFAYTIYVYHQSSDVNFNIYDATTMSTSGYDTTDGNYTVVLDFPRYTTADAHAGSGGWNIDNDDLDNYDADDYEELYDERNWRCQAPTYNPSDDTSNEYDTDLERLTNAFAIRFTFNDTVSTTDGAVTQINMTITEGTEPIDLAISGVYIYQIFTQVITAPYNYDYSIQFGSNISVSTVQSGRVVVPKDDDNLGTFTAYSTIGA